MGLFFDLFLSLCGDRVLMDKLVPRERLEKTVLKEMLDLPDLLDQLVPLDLRFVQADTTVHRSVCLVVAINLTRLSVVLGSRWKHWTQGITRTQRTPCKYHSSF